MSHDRAYRQLWRVVDGAVTDCFKNHPDYLTGKGRRSAQGSLVKRVTGTVLSFAVQAARGQTNHLAVTEPGATLSPASGPLALHASAVTLSPRTQPAFWVRKGYNRYRYGNSYAVQCATLQRWIEVNRACFNAVANALGAA